MGVVFAMLGVSVLFPFVAKSAAEKRDRKRGESRRERGGHGGIERDRAAVSWGNSFTFVNSARAGDLLLLARQPAGKTCRGRRF